MLAACAPPASERSPAVTTPATYRGSGLARQVCAQCHDIATGSAPVRQVNAPAFSTVANRPDMTVEKLRAWMAASHPTMPNYLLNATEVDDVATYIMSLRR